MTGNRNTIKAGLAAIMGREQRKAEAPPQDGGAYVPKSRQGKKALLTHHDPAVLMQLKQLAMERDTTQQKLIAEGLNLLFVKYGKPPLA
jgi:hypothetical protein